ncbi:nectin-2-like [Micropterus salmoides]|uniref:nectin-2-like n=1 Tax=Micropterus salmoides TaxID=27706 RepID=UPI0018EB2BC2|nr:nectin-2-like [Micropterus salmoides]
MKTCSKSPIILLELMYITLLPVLEAQKVKVWPEVTGYLGQDVTLPCHFIPGSKGENVAQVQWDLNPPQGEKLNIIVSNGNYGIAAQNTFLKERVDIKEQSLIIRQVEMRDAGSYTCNIAAFPSGSFEGNTNLVVQKQMPLSPKMVSAIVIAVMLLLLIMATITYLIFIRRLHSSVRHRVHIDTGGSVIDVARPPVIEEDVVYSDIKLKSSRDATPSFNDKHTETARADDVTYSEVVVLRQQPK